MGALKCKLKPQIATESGTELSAFGQLFGCDDNYEGGNDDYDDEGDYDCFCFYDILFILCKNILLEEKHQQGGRSCFVNFSSRGQGESV